MCTGQPFRCLSPTSPRYYRSTYARRRCLSLVLDASGVTKHAYSMISCPCYAPYISCERFDSHYRRKNLGLSGMSASMVTSAVIVTQRCGSLCDPTIDEKTRKSQ